MAKQMHKVLDYLKDFMDWYGENVVPATRICGWE